MQRSRLATPAAHLRQHESGASSGHTPSRSAHAVVRWQCALSHSSVVMVSGTWTLGVCISRPPSSPCASASGCPPRPRVPYYSPIATCCLRVASQHSAWLERRGRVVEHFLHRSLTICLLFFFATGLLPPNQRIVMTRACWRGIHRRTCPDPLPRQPAPPAVHAQPDAPARQAGMRPHGAVRGVDFEGGVGRSSARPSPPAVGPTAALRHAACRAGAPACPRRSPWRTCAGRRPHDSTHECSGCSAQVFCVSFHARRYAFSASRPS